MHTHAYKRCDSLMIQKQGTEKFEFMNSDSIRPLFPNGQRSRKGFWGLEEKDSGDYSRLLPIPVSEYVLTWQPLFSLSCFVLQKSTCKQRQEVQTLACGLRACLWPPCLARDRGRSPPHHWAALTVILAVCWSQWECARDWDLQLSPMHDSSRAGRRTTPRSYVLFVIIRICSTCMGLLLICEFSLNPELLWRVLWSSWQKPILKVLCCFSWPFFSWLTPRF